MWAKVLSLSFDVQVQKLQLLRSCHVTLCTMTNFSKHIFTQRCNRLFTKYQSTNKACETSTRGAKIKIIFPNMFIRLLRLACSLSSKYSFHKLHEFGRAKISQPMKLTEQSKHKRSEDRDELSVPPRRVRLFKTKRWTN